MTRHLDDFSGRIRFIAILLFIFAGIIAYRLFDLQVISASYWQEKASHQYVASQTESLIANRGTIYFREKNNQLISAAVIKEGFSAVINPSTLKNPEEVYDKISSVIPIEREEFLRQAKKENDSFEIISHRLEAEKAEILRKMAIIGLNIIPEEWRFYPGGNLASHVLGFVGYKDNDLVGQYGIEKSFEDFLKGTSEDAIRNSFTEAFLGLSREIFLFSPNNKKDVILTIEPSVQGFLETALGKIVAQYSAESAGGIIIEPKTGKILAMAAKPDFDPNFYNKVKNPALFLNPLVSNIMEVGSSMKPLTLSSALDTNSITSQTTYYDNGYLILDKSRIENYDGKARGKVDMQTVLDESLNTGAVFAMQQLGKENFRSYVTNFGLGEKTGIELPDEVKGNIASLSSPRDIEYATASFGQGIAPTPLEFTTAFSALANGGNLVKPYIIENGENKPIIKRQVLKKETSEEITRMLVKVVDEALLGGSVKMEHYSVAAKTGTAQIPLENQKGYSEDYLHTFVGYAPAFDPKFLVFLYLKRPQDVKYASYSLTPSFIDITKFLLNYYEVPPDR
ncbi:MAG: penicillin-binding protein 2 [Candidatus Tagabacteria bacterium]